MGGTDKIWHVWCLLRDQQAYVAPLERALGSQAQFTYDEDWDYVRLLHNKPDLILCVNDYPFAIAQCLDAARRQGIPSLALQDGILEWRCQYENPLFGAGGGAPQHQPVLADKIACIGAQSARQIARWGNADKAEVTGMPRLDYLLNRPRVPRNQPGHRILVMTAKNPGFTPEQRAITLQSLKDLKTFLYRLSGVDVLWRVSRCLLSELDVENRFGKTDSAELVNLIEQVDAVITTPSTAMLEALLVGRPVAALDYHNVPRFVPTAWSITARGHISSVVAELLDPPLRKMAFQADCLYDCLSCHTEAAPRVIALMERVIATARQSCGHEHAPSQDDLLMREADADQPSDMNGVTLAELYPDQPLFNDRDLSSLQVRFARLQHENRELRAILKQRGIRYGMHRFGRYVVDYLRERARTGVQS